MDKEKSPMQILAVPCDQAVILTQEQGEEILAKIRNSRTFSHEERFVKLAKIKRELAKFEGRDYDE